MERNAQQFLSTWAGSRDRKPLLMYGARQVGKTHLLKEFGRSSYDDVAYFDLERDASAREVFEAALDPSDIAEKLGRVRGTPIDAGRTLLVLDEAQASNRALASLKYFCEELPELAVVAAGSLLGVAVNQTGYTMPVGKVETYTLRPLSFDEYLRALGRRQYIDEIRECYRDDKPSPLHGELTDLFWQYLVLGGMPEPLARFAESGDMGGSVELQGAILDLYAADMAKYATPAETARIRDVWASIPSQLARENKKFQYKAVRSGGRAATYESAISWLSTAGLVTRCQRVGDARIPLRMQEDAGAFKIYLCDTGLLCRFAGLGYQLVMSAANRAFLDLGGIVENYVAQALTANGIAPRYWTSNTAEVDFVVEDGSVQPVPLEVKSSENVRSRSLSSYREKYTPRVSMRLSPKNFGFAGGVKSVPLYAAFCIGEEGWSGI